MVKKITSKANKMQDISNVRPFLYVQHVLAQTEISLEIILPLEEAHHWVHLSSLSEIQSADEALLKLEESDVHSSSRRPFICT